MNITGSCRVDREEQKVTLQGTTMRKYQWGMEVDEQCYNYKEQEWNEGEDTKADKNEIHPDEVIIGQLSPKTSISSIESIKTVNSNNDECLKTFEDDALAVIITENNADTIEIENAGGGQLNSDDLESGNENISFLVVSNIFR